MPSGGEAPGSPSYMAPRAAAAFFTAPGLTQRSAPYRPIPAHTPVTAVTLIFAEPSRAMTLARAPTRSSPSIRNAVFGFDNLILAPFAAAVNNAASDGTKSTWALRALGKAWKASRFTPALLRVSRRRAPSPGLSDMVV